MALTHLWFRQGLLDSVQGFAVVSVAAEPHPHHSCVQGVDDDLGVRVQRVLQKQRGYESVRARREKEKQPQMTEPSGFLLKEKKLGLFH